VEDLTGKSSSSSNGSSPPSQNIAHFGSSFGICFGPNGPYVVSVTCMVVAVSCAGVGALDGTWVIGSPVCWRRE